MVVLGGGMDSTEAFVITEVDVGNLLGLAKMIKEFLNLLDLSFSRRFNQLQVCFVFFAPEIIPNGLCL
jgi:hypothetical protein